MKAEELVARCAAQNIDLMAVAKSGTNLPPRKKTLTKVRFGQRWTNLIEGSDRTLTGKQTQSMTEQEWSVQELGQAAPGLPEIVFMAACFSWAGQAGLYVPLHDRLMAHALRMRREQQWPLQVRGVDGHKVHYLEHLCAMVLDQDQHQQLFELHDAIPAIYLGVTEEVWQRQLLDRFMALRGVYWDWLNQAARRIQSRLRDDDELDQAG